MNCLGKENCSRCGMEIDYFSCTINLNHLGFFCDRKNGHQYGFCAHCAKDLGSFLGKEESKE